ncbi:MAG: bifunctional 5,10-methylenetetrahydrofolate dehydrogenase/5,10-methenyltetrahydrofolate cyclohydrolase, partial [Rhodospirillales bacterium]
MTEAKIIDGRAFAGRLKAKVAETVAALSRDHGARPVLAIVLVGDDPASHVYIRAKGRQAEDAGMGTMEHLLPAETPEAELLALIEALNKDAGVSGILVQLPLPDPIDQTRVLAAVDPMKDVDGFHPVNVGRLWSGAPGFIPCTPWGCLVMLKETLGQAGGDLKGKRALVIGRSNIVGKPMAALLLSEHATVTIAHSRTEDLAARSCEADVLVAAVGEPGLVRGDWIKPGAAVLDVGINRVPAPEKGTNEDGTPPGPNKTRIVGDVAFDEAKAVAGWITPVPGG